MGLVEDVGAMSDCIERRRESKVAGRVGEGLAREACRGIPPVLFII